MDKEELCEKVSKHLQKWIDTVAGFKKVHGRMPYNPGDLQDCARSELDLQYIIDREKRDLKEIITDCRNLSLNFYDFTEDYHPYIPNISPGENEIWKRSGCYGPIIGSMNCPIPQCDGRRYKDEL